MDINQTAVLPRAEAGLRHFMTMVYGWMSLGLFVTGACGAYMASDPRMILNLVHTPVLFYGLMIAELGLVLVLSAWVGKMEVSTAKFAFLFYAALTGVSLSVVYLAYTGASIASTFFLTAGLFGIMSAYGYMTKTDLTAIGNICFMGLIGIILASVVNIWMRSPAIMYATSYIGILVFTGLTAYDSQKIKAMYDASSDGSELETKSAILGALSLYLDFINLFLSLLRVMGRRRD
ncbi:MAG: Bax inhibitor-1/YccA family protein [Elusimicrobiota bacterium]